MMRFWRTSAMEKQSSNNVPGVTPEVDDLQLQPEPSVVQDVDIGHMLQIDPTPEQERKVLRKLDMMYVH